MLTDYNTLKKYITNWVHDEIYKYSDFKKEEVIEVHISCGAVIRKDMVMNRVKNLINKLDLNLYIFEENDKTDRFVIAKK